jgi:hypothetical protein
LGLCAECGNVEGEAVRTNKFYSLVPSENKNASVDYTPEAIAAQIAEFQKRGGKIDVKPPGHSAGVSMINMNTKNKAKRVKEELE